MCHSRGIKLIDSALQNTGRVYPYSCHSGKFAPAKHHGLLKNNPLLVAAPAMRFVKRGRLLDVLPKYQLGNDGDGENRYPGKLL
jgi:hypothetical protein